MGGEGTRRMFMDGGDLLHAAENKNTGAQARAHELFSEGGIQYRLKAAMMRNDLGLMRALIVDGGADPNLPDSTCHRMKTAVHSVSMGIGLGCGLLGSVCPV